MMRTQGISLLWTSLAAGISFLAAFLINRNIPESQFWVDIFLGLLSGAFLVSVQSAVLYRIERREALRKLYETSAHFLNRVLRARTRAASKKIDVLQTYDMVADCVDFYFVDLTSSVKQVNLIGKKGDLFNSVQEIEKSSGEVFEILKECHDYLDENIGRGSAIDWDDPRAAAWRAIEDSDGFRRLTEGVGKLREHVVSAL
jgi:hypothetical protein